ncbi:MAG: NnrS family protein [Armatimonadetes bacterium]|nr:NnrS family protein [Armatimonadota bacterium]
MPNRSALAEGLARASVEIYRPFFLAGVISVLTAGCLLGAVALLGIALNGSYTASAWTPYVLAHANSQVYGWVGFFVMGFALQQHAPTVAKNALFERLAAISLVLMAVGIGVRFAAEPLSNADPGIWVPIGVASCILQTISVFLFMGNIAVTRHRSGPMTWQTALVFASMFWLVVIALAEPYFFAETHGGSPQERVLFIAEWFPPYREAQFLGFVTMMIFGVACVKMSSCFGAEGANPRQGLLGFGLWQAGLLARMAGWVLAFRQDLRPDSLLVYRSGGLLLAAGAVFLIASTQMFRRLQFAAPSHKFVRGAFTWLLIGGLLMAVEPLHLAQIGQPFSHAYTGAIRHAVTVGFISQMILGVGMHVVARMNDMPAEQERQLWASFWLLNIGNALRVALEIGTDYSGSMFLPMGFTGFIELTGLLLWGGYVAKVMLDSRRLSRAS